MANPFLVLGGIAVGIVVAAMGVLQVPGWVKSAQNASAINDLSSAGIAEAAASNLGLGYMNGEELGENAVKIGASFTPSAGVKLCVTRSDDATAFAAVAISPSGAYFARTAENTKAVEGATAEEALDAIGGLPAGVPEPVIDGDCADGAEVPGSDANAGGGDGGGGGGGDTVTPVAASVCTVSPSVYVATASQVWALGVGVVNIQPDGSYTSFELTGDAEGENIHSAGATAAGVVYAATYNTIIRVEDDGSTTTIATVSRINDLTVSTDGTIYWVGERDRYEEGVWATDPATGDTTLVTSAPATTDQDIEVAADGTVFFTTWEGRWVLYRVATDGSVNQIVNNTLMIPDIAIDDSGNVLYEYYRNSYIPATGYYSWVNELYQITPDGATSTRVGGNFDGNAIDATYLPLIENSATFQGSVYTTYFDWDTNHKGAQKNAAGVVTHLFACDGEVQIS